MQLSEICHINGAQNLLDTEFPGNVETDLGGSRKQGVCESTNVRDELEEKLR